MIALRNFLDSSPTAFHAAEVIVSVLETSGYQRLDETEAWSIDPNRGYYIVRDGRAVISFIPGKKPASEIGLRIAAAHLDSPLWKLKMDSAERKDSVWRFPVEAYGSPIFGSWLDRELEVAGSVNCRVTGGGVSNRVWRSHVPMGVIPSLAIHLNRDVNKGVELNPQNHMAVLMPGEGSNPLISRICNDLAIDSSDILAAELYLVPSQSASIIRDGEHELVSSGRLDNLAMAHAILDSLPSATEIGDAGIVAAWFDAEEVGSRTASGASSLFLDELLERIVLSGGGGREELMRTRRLSFLVSADMAHAVNPNYSDRHDGGYAPVMGKGPVLKSHGQRHYATDVHSEALISAAAGRIGLSMQKLIFRSDLACGYSLGPLASAAASIRTVDVGNPLWAMHSARETGSMEDHKAMVSLFRECWKS